MVLLEKKGITVRNGQIKLQYWFTAVQIIEEHNFYTKGYALQMELREAGYDVKMNMQDYSLVIY